MLPPVNVPVKGMVEPGGATVNHIPGVCCGYPLLSKATPICVPLGNCAMMFRDADWDFGTFSYSAFREYEV